MIFLIEAIIGSIIDNLQHICFKFKLKVYLGKENSVNIRAVFECMKNSRSLIMAVLARKRQVK